MAGDKETVTRIREATRTGRLKQPFRAADVNQQLGITYGGVFLPSHRVGDPGKNTDHFVQVERGLYRLK